MSRDLASRLPLVACTLAVAVAMYALAAADGGFGLTSRTLVVVVVWAGLVICAGVGILQRPDRLAVACCALFAAFSVWTLASTQWAANAERAFLEFDRAAMYTSVLLLALLVLSHRTAASVADGLFLALVAVGAVALVTRLLPDVVGAHLTPLPSARTRLSYPVGYWNGLAMLVALAAPLAVRGALVYRHAVMRALSVAVLPLVGCVAYLASSRGGVVTALAALLVFVAVVDRRWRAIGVLAAGGLGTALTFELLSRRHALVDGPLGSAAAHQQGRTMALLLLFCMALAGGLFLVGEQLRLARRAPSRSVSRLLVAAAIVVAVGAALASHPVARFQAFKEPVPVSVRSTSQEHLLSGAGNGRWQFWGAAVDEFRSEPLHGKGAGSFAAWWAKHASFPYFVENAHSLYLETLGDLGLVGFLLLAGAFLTGLAGCAASLRAETDTVRATAAGGVAVFAGFAVGAAIDWLWQLTAVGAAGFIGLGVALSADRPRTALPRAYRAVLVALAWVVVACAALPWLTAGRIADSQAAVRRGDLNRAREDARAAQSLQPWAASPDVQLALVAEADGRLGEARARIHAAADRAAEDWRIWFLAARIEREAGRPGEAARSLARARSLNVRSPVFRPR